MRVNKGALSCVAWALFLFFFTGCGYRFYYEGDATPLGMRTVSVPYILGDVEGDLTAHVIAEISKSGLFSYRCSGADAELVISIIELHDENIGFRYDRHKNGELSHSIIPTETRTSCVCEVSLLGANKEVLLPKTRLMVSIDYDHEFETTREYRNTKFGLNTFSLGQLTDFDEAKDAASRPLNKLMARKICDYLEAAFP